MPIDPGKTVTLHRLRGDEYAAWSELRPSRDKTHLYERLEFVPLSDLRRVEEELRELAAGIVKCPVCEGAGNLPANFYDNLPTTDMRTHCRKCAGAGILTRAALAELAALSPVQGEHEQDGGA
mgnify:CR=1 FL=1